MKISIVSLLCILFLACVQARLSRTLGLRGNSLSGSPARRQLESKSMSKSKSEKSKGMSKSKSKSMKSKSKSKSKSEKSKGMSKSKSKKSKSKSKSKSMKSKSKSKSMKSKSKSKSKKSKSKSKSKSKKSKSKSKRIAGGQLSRLGALEGGDFGAAFTPLALGGVSGVPAIEVAAANPPEIEDSSLTQLASLAGLSSVASPVADLAAPEEPEVVVEEEVAFAEPAQVVPALPAVGPDPLEQLIARPVVTTTEAAPAAEEAAPAAEEAAPETGPAMTTVQSAGMARLALLGDSF